MMSRRTACWLSLFILGLASACTEKELTVEPVPLRPRLVIMPPSVSADLPVGSSTDPANSLPLPAYDNAVIVQLRVDGMIGTVARSDTYLQAYSGNLDGSGIYVESAFSACYANVAFRFSLQGSMGPGPCLYYPAPRSSWADTSLVQGAGTVNRGPGIPQFTSDCNYQPCHSYSGSQTVSVTPLAATLQLAGSASQVDSGQTVIFTATVGPSSIKGLQVPLKVLSWRWLAGGGGAGQTTACSTPINPCSAIIRESGAMELTALANGAEQADSAAVTVSIDEVRLGLGKSQMRPSIRTAARNAPSTQMITVSVVGSAGQIRSNRDVLLGLASTDNTAGHIHGADGKPAGDLDRLQVNTGSSGVATVTFTAPDPSGPVLVIGSSPGARSTSVTIDVGILGLAELGPGANYGLTGDKPIHPLNHFATSSHIAQLMNLANKFYAQFGLGLTFNDTSLPLGGLYDVGSIRWTPPHKGHREGLQTDVRTNGLPEPQLVFLRRTWRSIAGIPVYDETATSEPHYHLTTAN